jgi:hypothetical protein
MAQYKLKIDSMKKLVKEKWSLWTTLKQLKELPATFIILTIFIGLYWFKDYLENVGSDPGTVEIYNLQLPVISILITKMVSFLTIYLLARVFIFIGFNSIHKGIEGIFNGQFAELEGWQRATISVVFLFSIIFAILNSPPTGL